MVGRADRVDHAGVDLRGLREALVGAQRRTESCGDLKLVPTGLDVSFEPLNSGLALTDGIERNSKVVLSHGPTGWHAIAGELLQSSTISRYRFLKPLHPTIELAEALERVPEVVLGRSPVKRHAFTSALLQGGSI